MIRLRKVDGSVMAIPPEAKFVELVNEFDDSVMVVLFQVQPGMIVKINPGSVDAARYEAMFSKVGVKFSPTMIERKTNDQS